MTHTVIPPTLSYTTMNIFSQARVLLLAPLLLAHASGGEFTQSLTPEKVQAAGLAKLTPQELAELETLVELYKAGALAKAVAATASPPVFQSEPSAAKPKKPMPDWVGALITLKRAENAPAKRQTMESRIAGDFDGWSGRTNFRLENGQVWTQVNNGSYDYTPALKSPKVRIFPAMLGTFWLEIEGVGQRCRVKPLRLE